MCKASSALLGRRWDRYRRPWRSSIPQRLCVVVESLAAEVKPVRDVRRGQLAHRLTAVDVSAVKTLKSIAEAAFMNDKNGGPRFFPGPVRGWGARLASSLVEAAVVVRRETTGPPAPMETESFPISLLRRNTRTRPSRRLRLEVEAVEGRTLLSTLLVGPGGSIQAAVNAAKPGDTIKVAPGTYHENILIEKPVTLLGAQAGVNPITGLRKNPANESTIDGSIAVQSTSKVRIDGFSLNDPGHVALLDQFNQRDTIANNVVLPGAAEGALLVKGDLTNLVDNEFESTQGDGIGVVGSKSVPLNDTVQGNLVENSGLNGIDVFGANGLVVKGNLVSGSKQSGLNVQQSVDVKAVNNFIVTNNVGVNFANSSFDLLQGNTVEFSRFEGIFATFDKTDLILANTVSGNATSGLGSAIVLDGVSGGEAVENNSVLNNHSNGIEVDFASPGVKVSGNTVENNGGDGIGLNSTSKSIIAANTVKNNQRPARRLETRGFLGRKPEFLALCRIVENNAVGIHLDAKSAGNTVTGNIALGDRVFDAEDNSTGTRTAGTANFWIHNTLGTANPPGIRN
jgi:parallel beta-helix repeat protein